MRVAISGSSGLIGTALARGLAASGHEVLRLVRRAPAQGEVQWDPATGVLDSPALAGCDAVVNLAGVGIGDHRWTDRHKRAVRESRVQSTTLLATTLAGMASPPAVLASASAVGFYGHRGDEQLTEQSATGDGFLAGVTRDWEAATKPAEAAGVRVVHLRSGVVLSRRGGALAKQLTPFRLGLGGRLGSGRQYMSWISINDEVGAIEHVLATPALRGPVNLTAPGAVTNVEFTRTLGRVLHRPTFARVPVMALKAVFSAEMTEDMLLASQRAQPAALESSGYSFRHASLEPALREVLTRADN